MKNVWVKRYSQAILSTYPFFWWKSQGVQISLWFLGQCMDVGYDFGPVKVNEKFSLHAD
jgi:hypothetical protein